jgi:hypothetical protein
MQLMLLGLLLLLFTELLESFTRLVSTPEDLDLVEKKVTTYRDDRFLVSNILRDRQMTAVMIRNRLQEVRQANVSERTVRRRLAEGNLGFYRPTKVPKLTQNHRRLRLEFARQHQDWTVNHWRRVYDLQMGVRGYGEGQENVLLHVHSPQESLSMAGLS